MPTEMFNHCLLCNPEVNWLEVELRSERNEPITGLTVRITNPSSGQTLKKARHKEECGLKTLWRRNG